jgi:hypothetical protein
MAPVENHELAGIEHEFFKVTRNTLTGGPLCRLRSKRTKYPGILKIRLFSFQRLRYHSSMF